MPKQKTTHFGQEDVALHEKQPKVNAVFERVAQRYDVMNDLMSMGMHRLWKRIAIDHLRLQPHHCVCEMAAGTGDLTRLMAAKLNTGTVVMSDINPDMLALGRDRMLDLGFLPPKVSPVLANGEQLPFADASFDRMICAFGIRNMTHIDRALSQAWRCLKPGGRFVVLEFSKMQTPWLQAIYDAYSFKIIPQLGAWVANDRASYDYLVASIRRHPDQKTFASWFEQAGFVGVQYHMLAGGAVAIHVGSKV